MPVLQRKELEASPLADLHAIASELGLEGFRGLRKADLVETILRTQGGEAAVEEPEPDEVPADEALDAPAAEEPEDEEPEEDEPEEDEPEEDEPDDDEPEPEDEEPEDEEPEDEEPEDEEPEEDEPEPDEPQGELVTGVLDVLPNGSAFLRSDPAVHSRDDVYVSPAQIRRCELRSGDEVSGPVRPARRNERHPSLVHVETVNGADAEPPAERPWFGDLTPVFPSEKLSAPAALDGIPFGRGSRVAISGPPGSGATSLLREIAAALGSEDVIVALAGVRPEEVPEWAAGGAQVVGGSYDRSPEPQAQAAELAVERAKRRVERGEHAIVVVDSLEALSPGARRRVFGAGRALEEGGSLTVIAAVAEGSEALRWATTRVVLEAAGPDSRAPKVDGAQSGTLRADRLS